ncbi:MAG TPA: oligosaccharide flippase family protein, partial [Burkholderiales bacterium]|nr:oligosaccharide flippase family protein [Burkholderiales bacterium]
MNLLLPMGVRKNTLFNLAGTALIVAIGLVTVPAYLHLIGEERYGALAVIWLYLGYFGFFDLGLSRSATNFIARLQDAPPAERQSVFWTALCINGLFGVIGGLVLYMIAAPVVGHLLKMPDSLKAEVLATLPWVAFAVPAVSMSGVLIGTLEGRERFATVNAIQAVGSVLMQGVPLLVAFTHRTGLDWLIPATILARASIVPMLFVSVSR